MPITIDPFSLPPPSFDPPAHGERVIVLGGGCFWCTEAVYTQLDGVRSVLPGYAGDGADVANYDAVCSGQTEHAEVIRIVYDADKLSLGTLLKLFFAVAHDPTQRDRQGNDVGRQYRSVIFYADEAQKKLADAYIQELDAAKVFDAPIATEVVPLTHFFEAEVYHHDYAARNPTQPYIRGVSMPKVKKLQTNFGALLKSGG